jgi:hypothetical protein
MGDLIPLMGVCMPFLTAIAIVGLVVRGPKAKAKAEIMKAEALARLEDKKRLLTAVDTEELSLSMAEQAKRIEELETEISFLKRMLEDRSAPRITP